MSQAAINLANIIAGLHANWMPHPAQAQILHAIFYQQKKRIFIECGRKFGKTDIVCYILWRALNTIRKADGYYFAPSAKQAKELIWANHRVQNFGPRSFLKGKPNETETRMRFKNESFLKLDGSESYEAYRGVEPDIFVYDEYKDFHTKFHPAMDPNRGAKAGKGTGIHVIVGTPPETDSHPDDPEKRHPFYELADEINEEPEGAYFNFPTIANPYIPKEWVESQKIKYEKRGDLAGFFREYEAKRVKGGPGHIFPMWDEKKLVRPHEYVMSQIERDAHHMQWYIAADPGTTTVFGVLFVAVNPYNQHVYILDEIYAKTQMECSTSKIIPKIAKKRSELHRKVDDWVQIYDEAAAWFSNEAAASYGEGFLPTHKSWDKKEAGLSLIKDQMLDGKIMISKRCINLIWEIENYIKDKNGNIPKVNDHLLDAMRYSNAAAGLCLEEDNPPEPIDPDDEQRFWTQGQDIETIRRLDPDYFIDQYME